MKRFLLYGLVLVFIGSVLSCATAIKLPDLFNLLKLQVDNMTTEITGIKVENKVQAKKIVGIEQNITTNARDISGVKQENNIQDSKITGMETNIGAISNKISVFGDRIKSIAVEGNYNDTDLMWKIIYGLLGIISVLIGWLGFVIKNLLRVNEQIINKDDEIRYIDKKSKFYSGKLQLLVDEEKWKTIIKEKEDVVL